MGGEKGADSFAGSAGKKGAEKGAGKEGETAHVHIQPNDPACRVVPVTVIRLCGVEKSLDEEDVVEPVTFA